MHKDLTKIAKALEAQGFVEVTKRGHMLVYRGGRHVATFSGTPSDWRSMKSSMAAAGRAGFDWPARG